MSNRATTPSVRENLTTRVIQITQFGLQYGGEEYRDVIAVMRDLQEGIICAKYGRIVKSDRNLR